MIVLDTETCGLHGMMVLLQWAENDGEIKLFEPWRRPICETLELFEYIMGQDVCGFNLAFDHFHLCKLYTTFRLHPDKDAYPDEIVDELAVLEKDARFGPCLKPRRALDLMLHARKGPYQSLMDRSDITIRRVPAVLATQLAKELGERIQLDGIYFARRKDPFAPQWAVYDRDDSDDLKDVGLKFKPKGDLKTLAMHIGCVEEDELLRFSDVELDKKFRPEELGYAPYALATGRPGRWNWAWPEVIKFHIDHWAYNDAARKYASDDVRYTRALYQHFGCPEFGDDDSELACMVAACRWRGFKIETDKLQAQADKAKKKAAGIPTAPRQVLAYITDGMSQMEKVGFGKSTKKATLEKYVNELKCDCVYDGKINGCEVCNHTGEHFAVSKIRTVLAARKATKRRELFEKLVHADRFHASFKVIGTLSSRMSGADGLNPQAINRDEETRECFTLADDGYVLCGGDFDSFEVALAAAAYDNDPDLVAALQTKVKCHKCDDPGKCPKCKGDGCKACKGTGDCEECRGTGITTQKLHGLFAMALYPGKTYEQVAKDKTMYTNGKTAVFSQMYGGDWQTIVKRQGFPEDVAKAAAAAWAKRFPGVGRAQQKIDDMFCSMKQPGGIGTKVIWNEPADYIESIMGFRRYFTLENQICKALFDLGNNVPTHWKNLKLKVQRSDKLQTVAGATASALFGAAFGIQGCVKRAAANHVIQSSGATITKAVQRKAWDLQPYGIHDFRLYGLNIHDEILFAAKPEYAQELKAIIDAEVESYRPKVPLIGMEFKIGMKSWAEK